MKGETSMAGCATAIIVVGAYIILVTGTILVNTVKIALALYYNKPVNVIDMAYLLVAVGALSLVGSITSLVQIMKVDE